MALQDQRIRKRAQTNWHTTRYSRRELLHDISRNIPLIASKIRAELRSRDLVKLTFIRGGEQKFEKILRDLIKAAKLAEKQGKESFDYNTAAVPGKEHLFKGSKKVTVKTKDVLKISEDESNFSNVGKVFRSIIPGLGKFWDLSHVEYSNLQSKVSILLAEWADDDPRRPALRALSVLIKQADNDIHKGGDVQTTVKDLIEETVAFLETPFDVTTIWEPVFTASRLKGVITVTFEDKVTNQRRGSTLSKELGKLVKKVEKGFVKDIEEQLRSGGMDLANLTGSPGMKEAAEIILVSTLDPKAKSVRKVRSKGFKTKTKSKALSKTGKKVTAALARSRGKARRISTKTRQESQRGLSPIALASLINKGLPAQLRENMVAPALVWRTGRFAESVRVSSIVKGIVEYTYLKKPYGIFEIGSGSSLATPERDPRSIIDQSIRQVAAKLIQGKFTTRRI